jgi:hypothetical protein
VAPVPVKLTEDPGHTAVDDAEAFTVKLETVKLIVPEFVQPNTEVPDTVYTVVTVGETTMLLPVNIPGVQV